MELKSQEINNQIKKLTDDIIQQHGHNYIDDHIHEQQDLSDEILNHNCILVRHGVSLFNLDWLYLQKQNGEDAIDKEIGRTLRLNPIYIDSNLSNVGILQTLHQQDLANKIDFSYVFLSPMKRIFETTVLLFKNHPNKQKIKFIVIPQLTEGLGMSSSIQLNHQEVREQFQGLDGIYYDFSQIDKLDFPEFFYIDILTNQTKRAQILQELKKGGQNIGEYILSLYNSTFPVNFESCEEIFERSQIAKQIIQNYTKNQKDQKIMVISHAVLLSCFTSQGVVDGQQYGGIRGFRNCYFIPYNL